MKTILYHLLVVGMMMPATFVVADEVTFRRGEIAPPLAINPPEPTNSDLISFTTPLDAIVYGNSCDAASQLGGSLLINRDNLDYTIDIVHDGNPPLVCPLIYDPVSGATGSFGPLAAGNWVLRDANNTLEFTVTDGVLFGDFNLDGILNVVDIDLLSAEVRGGTHDATFDLNDDLLVNELDRRIWVEELKSTFFGDSNLDGRVDSADLNALAVNWRLTDATSWAQGDFDTNENVDAADLNEIGKHWQNGVTVAPVPEPSSLILAFSLLLIVAGTLRVPTHAQNLRFCAAGTRSVPATLSE